jgi:hypothetical protein
MNRLLTFMVRRLRKWGRRLLLGYRRLSLRAKSLFWVAFLVVGLIIVPQAISRELTTLHQAKFYFIPPAIPPNVGDSFPVELHVQTSGTSINSVGTIMKFNPLYLEVVSMTTDKSFCTFYLDNTFDNITGEVRITCGTPNPGFTGDSLVVHLTMRARIAGSTDIHLSKDDTQILANNGKGTNILNASLPNLPMTFLQLY